MDIKEIFSTQLDEKYYSINHPSGLRILILPKKEYSSKYAIFGTHYGSIDTRFHRSDEKEFTVVPEGIAHFLEHKLFESKDKDAFERYAKTGASANAYTSFDRTCYLFSCTDNFTDSLEILLDFVQSPYFTKETVEKEQGIIGQEIRMYEDVPNWQVLFNLLRSLYHNHPVRIDIAGTVDSIAKITPELLYKCYNTFYNLSNMVLCVAGNVEVEEVVRIADKILKPVKPIVIDRNFPDEPHDVVRNFISQKLSVAVPVFALGFKEDCEVPERTLKEQIETNILLEILAGNTSPLYRRLLEQGLINTSFGSEYFIGYGYASVIFEGESKDPQAVAKAINEEVERIRKDGINKAAFERARKLLYGRTIMAYNDVENVANGLVATYFNGYGLFDDIDIYKTVTAADIEKRLKNQLNRQQSALSVILPA